MLATITPAATRPERQPNRWRFILPWLVALLALAPAAPGQTNLPAFPGAVGFGATAVGGRGGTVYHVRNLYDSGPGSFRDAVSQPNRMVVFDVGGYAAPPTTNTANNLPVQVANNVTIAGQTAPGDGFGLMGRGMSFAGSTNDICRFMRFRQGIYDANTGSPGLQVLNAATMIFDHVSIEFGQWDNIDGVSCTNLTFQYCLNADPINQQFGAHMEIGPVCWYRNLWANCHNRCPLARTDTVYVNNYVYDYQAGFTATGATATGNYSNFVHDVVNNFFTAGPATTDYRDYFFQISYQSIYASGNLYDAALNGVLSSSPAVIGDATVTNLAAPWSAVTTSLPTVSAVATIPYVLSSAGCSLPHDSVDLQVMADVFSLGTQGAMWTNQVQTGLTNNGYGTLKGGLTPVDSDQDGLPDFWELANGLNPNHPGDAGTAGVSGYPHLEEYLNWLAGPHAVVSRWTTTTNTVGINLWQFTAGFTNLAPTYAVSNPTNGTVTLLPDGHTANFAPNSNYLGLASFRFTVKSSGNIAMTNIVSVLVTSASVPTNILWTGDGGSNRWDNLATTNWLNDTAATPFTPGNGVVFDDTGSASPAINLAGTLTPALVSFTATNNYTLRSTLGGLLSGPMLLSKDGSGTLTIATSNNFSGGVDLFGGTLVLSNAAAAGTGPIMLNSGTLTLGASISNSLVVSGTALVVPGTNALMGLISGSGNLLFSTVGPAALTGALTNFSGTLTLASGTGPLLLQGNAGGANWGSASATFDLGTNGTTLQAVNNGELMVQLGALQGGANSTLASSTSVNMTFAIGGNGNNSSTTFAGTITNLLARINLVKTGTGTLTLTGSSLYTLNTTVSNGTLLLNGKLTSAAGSVTVNAGGTLGGTGTISSAAMVSINSGGTLAPGNPLGIFTVGPVASAPTLTLAAGSLTLMPIQHSPRTNATVTVAGPLNEGGTLNVTNVGGAAFASGDSFKLFNATAYSGSFNRFILPALPSGLVWKTDGLGTSGVLSVAVQPVISSVSVSVGGLTLAGRGGTNAGVYLLSSTNLATPLANWSRVLTNQFDASGNLRLANVAIPGSRVNFYLLQLQ